MRALGSTGSARAPAGSSAGDGVDGWVIDASSLVMMENPGSHSGNLESFPVQGVFDLAAHCGARAANSGSLRFAPFRCSTSKNIERRLRTSGPTDQHHRGTPSRLETRIARRICQFGIPPILNLTMSQRQDEASKDPKANHLLQRQINARRHFSLPTRGACPVLCR